MQFYDNEVVSSFAYKRMKNKPVLIILIIIGLLGGITLLWNPGASVKSESVVAESETIVSPTLTPISVLPADKIEVVHFHATQQCVSCITVGKYALQTIKDKFPKEYASGKIVFKEINGELPENQAIVNKYQARGSSLFVNAIRGDKDDIAEDTTVWRLINSESQFISYFENKINSLLGK